jgi:DNA-directed RNA polymerase subunit delta
MQRTAAGRRFVEELAESACRVASVRLSTGDDIDEDDDDELPEEEQTFEPDDEFDEEDFDDDFDEDFEEDFDELDLPDDGEKPVESGNGNGEIDEDLIDDD